MRVGNPTPTVGDRAGDQARRAAVRSRPGWSDAVCDRGGAITAGTPLERDERAVDVEEEHG
jgi:hypothetical protein